MGDRLKQSHVFLILLLCLTLSLMHAESWENTFSKVPTLAKHPTHSQSSDENYSIQLTPFPKNQDIQ